jgi:hypothetical protein
LEIKGEGNLKKCKNEVKWQKNKNGIKMAGKE